LERTHYSTEKRNFPLENTQQLLQISHCGDLILIYLLCYLLYVTW
jgi:hypothetical protein